MKRKGIMGRKTSNCPWVVYAENLKELTKQKTLEFVRDYITRFQDIRLKNKKFIAFLYINLTTLKCLGINLNYMCKIYMRKITYSKKRKEK